MLREWADQKTIDRIDQALTPTPEWRDPLTGLPAGFSEDEDDDWAQWENAMRR